jgi:flagellin
MINIMDEGLAAQKELVMRMVELGEQSANGTYSAQQRDVLQREYQALLNEFDRIGDSTSFNGIKLLRSTENEGINIMAGISGASTALLAVPRVISHRFSGVFVQKSDMNESGIIANNDLTLTRIFNAGYRSQTASNTNFLKAENPDVAEIEFIDSAGQRGVLGLLLSRVRGDLDTDTKYGSNFSTSPLPIPPVAVRQDLFYYAINSLGETTQSDFRIDTGSGQLPQSTTLNITFASSGRTASIGIDLSGLTLDLYDRPASEYRPSAIGFTNILTQAASQRSVVVLRNRINELSAFQGQIGAFEARMRTASSVLMATGENAAAAASRILDVDIASEAASLTRNRILQQTAVALLGQANLQPQLGLRLLREG